MHRKYSALSIIIMFIVISHAAWLWEGIVTAFEVGRFVNRGFLHGLWLPIYGTGALLLIFIFGQKRYSFWQIFFGSAVICTAIEYAAAVILEEMFHMQWWSYGGVYFNYKGRICLPVFFVFGLAGYFLIHFLAPYLDDKIQKLSVPVQITVCIIFSFLFILDFLFSLFNPNVGQGVAF